MQKQDFINHAYKLVMHLVEEGHTPDAIDEECILSGIKQCFYRGFTVRDTVKYMSLTKHVRPSLDERIACDRMNEISKYYSSRK